MHSIAEATLCFCGFFFFFRTLISETRQRRVWKWCGCTSHRPQFNKQVLVFWGEGESSPIFFRGEGQKNWNFTLGPNGALFAFSGLISQNVGDAAKEDHPSYWGNICSMLLDLHAGLSFWGPPELNTVGEKLQFLNIFFKRLSIRSLTIPQRKRLWKI